MRATAYPSFVRPKDKRVVAGVASGLASHFNVDVFYVRLAFIGAALISGLGMWAYAGLWLTSKASADVPSPPEARPMSRPANIGLAVLGVFVTVLVLSLVSGLSGATLVPLLIAGIGAFLAWQSYDRGVNSTGTRLSLIAGAVLVIAGLFAGIAVWNSSASFLGTLAAVFFTLVGVAVLAVPLVVRMWNSLLETQAEKAAADERAEIASRLHDSVLQTLALIQKRSEDPAEVARLARGQERELRGWLFEPQEKVSQSVFAAVEKAAGEVEDLYGVRIAPVTVGRDQDLVEQTQSLVLAAREAMVNAAKHSGVDKVDVYTEILGGELNVFVRDRGGGFDPAQIPDDRHGIRDSIRARVKKIGGHSTVKSEEGKGTEVSLTLPLS